MHSIVWLQDTTKMSGISERACIVSDSNGARWSQDDIPGIWIGNAIYSVCAIFRGLCIDDCELESV
jgi:hypothetical protein